MSNNILVQFDLKNILARQEYDNFSHFQMANIFTFPNGKNFAISNEFLFAVEKTS